MDDTTVQDLKNTIEEISAKIIPQTLEEFDAIGSADDVIRMLHDFVKAHCNDLPATHHNPDSKRDTPGAETFFWTLWETAFKEMGKWELEGHESSPHVIKAIAFVNALRAQPKGKSVWTIWGEDVDITSCPLLGPSIREANNGPFYYTGPDDSETSRPDVQNALAGAGSGDSTEECVLLALRRRREWLALQAFIARLVSDVGDNSYLRHGIWAARDGLEDWPLEPPVITNEPATEDPLDREDTAAYRALMVEGAAIWLCLAAPQLYSCAEIWGPNGNPDWKANQGAPGRGGARWKGVDGMDPEKQRWKLWKEVLLEVVTWYDKEASEGRVKGWRMKEVAVKALKAMDAAEQQ